jgi:GTP-binding protein YchF
MFSVGLVGLPNAGKSTLFNLLTKRSIPAENYPFTTIDPHDGIVEVPDPRIKTLAQISKAKKEIYTAIEFRDIAGLIKNAHKGEGLGNKFLSHIHEVDMVVMVLRSFVNDDIIHVENRVNPVEDEEILMLELTLHDQKRLESMIVKLQKDVKKIEYGQLKIQIAEKIMTELSNIRPASDFVMDETWETELHIWRKHLNLITDKPILRLANIVLEGQNIDFNSDFKLDILSESEFADLTKEERTEFGLDIDSGIDGLIRQCYKKLDLCTFLTTGEIESRAWTFTNGMFAPQCAGKIHTDFEKKFIKAEVVGYNDFVASGGWKEAWEKGLVKTLGKTYQMQDGDVVEFKIGA